MPFLEHLHAQHTRGVEPDLRISPQKYAEARTGFKKSGERDTSVVAEATGDGGA